MKILGISCNYHDSAAALVVDGIPTKMIQEERLSRIKHDPSFPEKSIEFVLENNKSVDYVTFYESPLLKFERFIFSTLSFYPYTRKQFKEGMLSFLKDKLWIRSKIHSIVDVDPENILFIPHHLSHAASSYLCSPFDESIILSLDGVGEWATTTVGVANEDKGILISREIKFPHSLGLLYSTFTGYLGFKVNDGEYKLMGLAPYGNPIYVNRIKENLIDIKKDGSYRLNLNYFSFHKSTNVPFNNKFIDLFGAPRDPKSNHLFEQRHADIAASIQKLTEEIIIKMVNDIYIPTQCKNLCISGGVGLNGVANYKILKETPIENIFIQPASGDAGAALGCALYTYYNLLGNKRKYVMNHVYYGSEYSNDEIKKYLNENYIEYEYMSNKSLIQHASQEIYDGKILGWFQGKSEWGPRALGNRSIIADARRKEMLKKVNLSVKFRESFRPFAPSVLSQDADTLFDIPIHHYPSKFMLYVCPVKTSQLPAITHVDGSARPQIVENETNQIYHELLYEFKKLSGVGCFLNTSFNLSGEPMVDSPADAYNAFEKTKIDELIIGNYIIQHQRT